MDTSQILVINCGSSSIKASLFQIASHDNLKSIGECHLQQIYSTKPVLELQFKQEKKIEQLVGPLQITAALKLVLDAFSDHQLLDLQNLKSVAHRYVHGGSDYSSNAQITPAVADDLKQLASLAPLHNPACFQGIISALELLPGSIPQIAVFDTAFHHSIPAYASTYAIPTALTTKYRIKRYGFHGIAHSFAWKNYVKMTGNTTAKLINMHLGSGCSVTAIEAGHSKDTSMGFTPAEGVMMATRAGDVDSGLIEFLCKSEGKTIQEILKILNFESGLQGVSELSSDMRTLLSNKSPLSTLAVEMFCYRIVKYVGAYIAVLGGVDALSFTGGIGENAVQIREKILDSFAWLGIKLDPEKNLAIKGLPIGSCQSIQVADSTAGVYVIAINENALIAEEALGLSR